MKPGFPSRFLESAANSTAVPPSIGHRTPLGSTPLRIEYFGGSPKELLTKPEVGDNVKDKPKAVIKRLKALL